MKEDERSVRAQRSRSRDVQKLMRFGIRSRQGVICRCCPGRHAASPTDERLQNWPSFFFYFSANSHEFTCRMISFERSEQVSIKFPYRVSVCEACSSIASSGPMSTGRRSTGLGRASGDMFAQL